MNGKVVVLGGGLAGLAASLRLADAGWSVIVLESRRRLGGRASSFEDVSTGRTLDNCQHVLMGCCTNLLDFYARLGVEDSIEWYSQTHWLRPDGGRDVMRASRLPAPFHMAGSLRRMRLLDRSMKRQVRRAMWRMLRMGVSGRLTLRNQNFSNLLDQWGQDTQVRKLFWEPIILSACNLSLERVAAVHAVQVFQDGFLAGAWHSTMGVPAIPLADLYAPAADIICQAGGEVRFGCTATSIGIEHRRVIGVQTKDEFVRADVVLSALPWERLDAILTDADRDTDARLGDLSALGHSAILGVHIVFDRVVMDEPHLVLPGRGVHWIFRKGIDADGSQHLHAVISAADEWMGRSPDDIRDAVLSDIHAAYPSSRQASVLLCRPVKERRATFAATMEAESSRPSASPSPVGPQGGDIEGLYLAGDWCRSGWPATMEGAVRSGYLAAAAISGVGELVPDAPAGGLVRFLAKTR
ncbi:MAG: hydroxysqualene dehydroxylase HpnE [Phycisphaerales bacterium]|nr:hydroxysqualene dehydroxylase HpnE [Phycisphaerales bacterium]